MKQIHATAILICLAVVTPSNAAPVDVGMHLAETASSATTGYHLSGRYSVETHSYRYRPDCQITHAGVKVDTITVGTGLVGVAQFPMKLGDVLPYLLLVKAGYKHTSKNEKYAKPSAVALTTISRGQSGVAWVSISSDSTSSSNWA
jgi:hypothetical protein